METTVIKTVVELDIDFIKSVADRLQRIEDRLGKADPKQPSPYLSPKEFCDETKISPWQYQMYKNNGQIQYIKVGRKVYILRNQVEKYFQGLMKLPD